MRKEEGAERACYRRMAVWVVKREGERQRQRERVKSGSSSRRRRRRRGARGRICAVRQACRPWAFGLLLGGRRGGRLFFSFKTRWLLVYSNIRIRPAGPRHTHSCTASHVSSRWARSKSAVTQPVLPRPRPPQLLQRETRGCPVARCSRAHPPWTAIASAQTRNQHHTQSSLLISRLLPRVPSYPPICP
jgi:hypothetical protein